MKPMNRKSALTLFAIIEAIILIPLILLLGMGKMSNVTFALALFTLLFLSLATVVFILYKYPATGAEKKEGFDPDSVEVRRTREGTIFEAITGIIVFAAWAIALATHRFIGEDGKILYREIFSMFFCVLPIVSLLIDVYTPSDLHLTGKLTNARQVGHAVRMNRILAAIFAVVLLILVTPALHIKWLIICLLAVALGVLLVFNILIHKDKQEQG